MNDKAKGKSKKEKVMKKPLRYIGSLPHFYLLPFTFLLSFCLVAGCGGPNEYYSGPSASLLPTHVRKIAIRPIVRSVEAPGHDVVGWEDKLRLGIQNELILDGRFTCVNDEKDADGVLYGEIGRILFEPLSYDASNVVKEVRLMVVMNIGFLDRVQNKVLWEEKNLDQEFQYFVSTQPGGMTDDEARDQLWERFAHDVVTRIVEGFGSVTGASEKKISPQTNPPAATPAPEKPAPAPLKRDAPPAPY